MKYDEFACLNQQLAALLRNGVSLEVALKRLCEEMKRGSLREELLSLEADLSKGVPLGEALKPRSLPDLGKRMMLIGAKSGNLPGALTMLADYYLGQSNTWSRLKGLMIYPIIAFFIALVVSSTLYVVWSLVLRPLLFDLFNIAVGRITAKTLAAITILDYSWLFVVVLGLLFSGALAFFIFPMVQQKMRWLIPAFKEASISQVAALLHLLLKGGVPLPEAFETVEHLENDKSVSSDLRRWRENIAEGATQFSQVAKINRRFPPMFVWTVGNYGDDLAAGFNRAAEVYRIRALHRAQMVLGSVLPIATVLLGVIILTQGYLVTGLFFEIINMFDI